VVAASLLAALPIVSTGGWYPDFGYLVFISWRLLRADPWPAWWAAPLGFVNDLFTGYPLGFSIALWSATMLALDLIDRRTQWRDYWMEWIVAAVLIAIDEWLQLRVAKLSGAAGPFAQVVPPLVISICVFPAFAWIVWRIDTWRLGR
jgi:rod shape-determining protein MreD